MKQEIETLIKILDWNRKAFLLIAQYPENKQLHHILCKYGFSQNHQLREYVKEFDLVVKQEPKRTRKSKLEESEKWLDSLFLLQDERENEI